MYAVSKDDDNNGYLVRFDNNVFEYIARVKDVYAASFDRNGDFFSADNSKDQLYRYSNVHNLVGYSAAAEAPDWWVGAERVPFVYDYSDGTAGDK